MLTGKLLTGFALGLLVLVSTHLNAESKPEMQRLRQLNRLKRLKIL